MPGLASSLALEPTPPRFPPSGTNIETSASTAIAQKQQPKSEIELRDRIEPLAKVPAHRSIRPTKRLLPHKPKVLLDIFRDLRALLREEVDQPDSSFLAPTDYAISSLLGLLNRVYSSKDEFPRPRIAPDGEGGIRLNWIQPERELRLVLPATPDQRKYIYHQAGREYAAEYDVSEATLAYWLRWLMNA